jgi:hypothetical protein
MPIRFFEWSLCRLRVSGGRVGSATVASSRLIPALTKRSGARSGQILVDALGLLLHAIAHPADVRDPDGGVLVMATLLGMLPFFEGTLRL